MGKHLDKIGKSRVGVFLESLGDVSKPLLKVAGSLTGIEALNVLSDSITTSKELTQEQKQVALSLVKMDMEQVTLRWESDNKSDSFLARNVRPLILMYTMFITSLFCFLDSMKTIEVKDHWVELYVSILLLMIAAYFGGRSVEKAMKK